MNEGRHLCSSLLYLYRQSDPCDEDDFSQQRNSDFDGLERCQSPVGTVDVILRYDVKAVFFFLVYLKKGLRCVRCYFEDLSNHLSLFNDGTK